MLDQLQRIERASAARMGDGAPGVACSNPNRNPNPDPDPDPYPNRNPSPNRNPDP